MNDGFLAPSEETKRKLKAEREAKELQTKRVKKAQAAERKAKRDKDKARIEEIESAIKANKEDAKTTKRPATNFATQQRDAEIKAYLDNPPYYGRSAFEHKDLVKKLCANPLDGNSERKWDTAKKLWGTTSLANLERLLNSRKWFPITIQEEWEEAFETAVADRIEAESQRAEAVSTVERENSIETIEEAAQANGGSAQLNARQKEEQLRQRERDELTMPATPADIAKCAELGITQSIIDTSSTFADLGPRCGLSNEARLLRWYDIQGYHVMCNFEDDPATYFDKKKLQPHIDKRIRELNVELEARAQEVILKRMELFTAQK